MKLWIDDIRPAPDGYAWVASVNAAKCFIEINESRCSHRIELIDLDHDAGDYIKLLDWLEETNRNYPIRIHSMNPVGVANMRAIIQRNGWKEIF